MFILNNLQREKIKRYQIKEGQTRRVIIKEKIVIKECLDEFKDENIKEYNAYMLYKDEKIQIVNKILRFEDNIIEAEKCITIKEFLESLKNTIENIDKVFIDNIIKDIDNILLDMDDIFLNIAPEFGKMISYKKKKTYIIEHTSLDPLEILLPDNWGITKEGELVLIDYSR